MKTQKLMWVLYASLLITIAAAGIGCAQGTNQSQSGMSTPQGRPALEIKGKIEFNKSLNSYVVMRVSPYYVYMILNPDSAVLDKLIKEAKVVTVRGTQPKGADYLLIETIDGQKYP